MTLCTICGEPIVLVPSLKERIRRFGNPAQHLFTTHAECAVRKRRDIFKRLETKS